MNMILILYFYDMNKVKKSKKKKDENKSIDPKEVKPSENAPSRFGGLPDRDLKRNLGCGG